MPHIPGIGEVAIFCAALVAASLGFLWFNAYPASMMMGDVGALSLGGAIGTVAVLAKQELVLLIAGGIFVVETLSVIIQVYYFKLTQQAGLPHGAAASSFRARGMAGNDGGDSFLDRFDRVRAGRAQHAETPMMELKGKRVMVVGLGVSGRAAARFLAARGAALLLTDKKADLATSELPAGEVHLGSENAAWLKGVDLVVTSPGIPRDSILLREAAAARHPGDRRTGARIAAS